MNPATKRSCSKADASLAGTDVHGHLRVRHIAALGIGSRAAFPGGLRTRRLSSPSASTPVRTGVPLAVARTTALLEDGPSAGYGDPSAGHVAGFVGGQHDVYRCQLCWLSRPAEKFAIAALVAAYGASVGEGLSEFTDELATIDAPFFMCGSAAFTR